MASMRHNRGGAGLAMHILPTLLLISIIEYLSYRYFCFVFSEDALLPSQGERISTGGDRSLLTPERSVADFSGEA